MDRFVCIHAHFYQPPRENPWLEVVEKQESAAPYRNWNERITAECYAANAGARILGEEKRIAKIVNNYARISFNFGPTLLQWLQENRRETYERILQADRDSRRRFSGHGSAMAQVYSHLIMPLANRRDKQTQAIWGIRDFEHRFGRSPKGMWLPETAVDLETLDVLALNGIRFTILAPHQAARFRPIGKRNWTECAAEPIDITVPYTVRLPSGRRIAVFFYNGTVARAVAFEGLLHRGESLVERLMGLFSGGREPQLAHFATDGESYGHHHKHGEMALAFALERIESGRQAALTNYAEFLERFPPKFEAQVAENTSWSCAHGIGRWRADCGCKAGGNSSWNQAWRAPLREALDWLRDALEPLYEQHAAAILRDPWEARDEYVSLVLDRSAENAEAFLAERRARPLDASSSVTALKLLELQRQAMLMYTSCGWFFDDLGGIETVQVLRHAGRAVELAEDLFGAGIREGFLERLAKARSNDPAKGSGREIFEDNVGRARVGLGTIAAHYAVSSLFQESRAQSKIFCYSVERENLRRMKEGKARLFLGRVSVRSEITWEAKRFSYGVLHLGDHNVSGGIGEFADDAEFEKAARELSTVFRNGELAATVRAVERYFDGGESALRLLLPDELDRVLARILGSTLTDAEAAYRSFYEDHALLIRFIAALGRPLPQSIRLGVECVLNLDLERACLEEEPDRSNIEEILAEAERAGARIDFAALKEALSRAMDARGRAWSGQPESTARLRQFLACVEVATMPQIQSDLWEAQNCYHKSLSAADGKLRSRAAAGDRRAAEWVRLHKTLGRLLHFVIDD